ncbi:hypothetical protein GCK72_008790 [Caenorhabditis remanei]|uniref:CRE-CPF-2 protein n=1 Tax=Caenorhabditis remanei TaxID=31234 RepID=E3M8I8_CAERE|nr:hypothetical protein GCK72_008790 [Caenorhabditis remanei]EFO94504.1 CRE-CPF-2 protein [Caenorhabditis remanei]KAF1760541.1 hypothetical protein GCK72_008790 [Caenorhabditis remanei]
MMSGGYKPSGQLNERSQRSVFVGNISYDVTEETIRAIFAKAGHVMSIKMVHDRETGKPKGYGFIEFPDINTADTAIRVLNGYELGGRVLRVDSAAGGMNMEEFGSTNTGPAPVEENPYGPECDAGKAPERISQTVASLAPEKMFELMKQLQEALKNNPAELNSVLVENPQLSYAVLQAAVVMRIVDPQTALGLLHRNKAATMTPFHQTGAPGGVGGVPPQMIPPQQSQQQMPLPIPPKPTFAHPGVGPSMGPPMGHPQGPPQYGRPPMLPTPQQQQQYMPPPQQQMPLQTRPPVQHQPQEDQEEHQNAQLLMQVMQLSEHDLQMLPPGDRDKIIELRQQLKRNVK